MDVPNQDDDLQVDLVVNGCVIDWDKRCETRPGPEFLLRHYHFEGDGGFKLTQYFYSDEWCTTPVYTLTARGQLHLREPSWIVPGGADADYTLHHVTMIAFSDDVLDQVVQRVNRSAVVIITILNY